MSKGPQVDKATADEGKKNELHVPRSMFPPDWKVEIEGESGKKVKNYHDLSSDLEVNKATIILIFGSQLGKNEEEKGEDIVYRFVNPKYQTYAEMEKMETEALVNFIIDQTSEEILEQTKDYQNVKVTLKKAGNQINLEITDGKQTKVIKGSKIKFKGRFYLKEAVELWQVKPPQPLKKAWWKTTPAKITLLTAFGTILLLLIIFRKKIWGWIKGKKQPKETIIL
ncbi:MAG: hypothetical protein I3273_00035 [Candidatus Moeniiplasma glomeromycotorum]|nr:hypothetical protein [Candidatus Moeniiplasma glomeromycotorum]MCE8167481.1 hypothetical protein [Candidatus Moeniiplasma glomeromycotorum]MCE8168505.1 hypothetical protein [Candidatus Moeniiplasma glomeromycotorum]